MFKQLRKLILFLVCFYSNLSDTFLSVLFEFDYIKRCNSETASILIVWIEKQRKKMKLSHLVLFHLVFVMCEPQNMRISTDDYIDVVLTYYRERNVHILTHLTCFSASKYFLFIFTVKTSTERTMFLGNNAKISYTLSRENIQSRFIGSSGKAPVLADTPIHAIQGFVVNKMCELDMNIFAREDHGILFKDNHIWLFVDNNSSLKIDESIVCTQFCQKKSNELQIIPFVFRQNTEWILMLLMRCQEAMYSSPNESKFSQCNGNYSMRTKFITVMELKLHRMEWLWQWMTDQT